MPLAVEMNEAMKDGGFEFDGVWLCCDLGYCNGLLCSARHFEEQLRPTLQHLFGCFSSHGMPHVHAGIDVRAMAHPDASGIENAIKAKVHVAKKGGGYIHHSDDSVPDSISLKQYCQVIEWARKHGAH